jgi:hypothetical protein
MKAIILPFASGDLLTESIAHFISNHSQIPTHKPVNQIANHAASQTISNHVKDNILNETISAYIAADSIRATHNIDIVKKNDIIFGFLPITSNDFSDIYHLPIATHTHANQIANHAQTACNHHTTGSAFIILNAIIRP